MRIAIFTDSFLPQINGVVTSIIDMSKGLADKGHEIYVIAPKYDGVNEFIYNNVQVKRVPSISAGFYEDFKFTSQFSLKILKYLRKEKIELIHFHTPITLGAQAIILSRLLKVPLIGTFHTFITDPNYLKHIKLNSRIIQRLSWAYVRIYYNKCDLITCPSNITRQELILNGFKKNIKVVPNGINIKLFNNSNWKEVKKKYNNDGEIILFVGRIAYEKNINYLLDCFSMVLKKMPRTKLLIIGDGPQMNELKSKINSLKLLSSVILLGKMEHCDFVKSSIFKACKIFVTASVTETQGIALLEAQANGLPAVGINARGTKELIKNSYNGYIVDYGDKRLFANRMMALLSNKKKYNRMSKNSVKVAKKYEIENIISDWEDIYLDLIKNEKN